VENINSGPTHVLIPEKSPTFSCKPDLYFDDFLKEITDVLSISLDELKSWEDETVILLLEKAENFLSALDKHKLLAFKNFDSKEAVITTPLEFSNIATVLNDDIPVTDSLDTIDPAYVAWAVEVLERFDSNNEIMFTDEVAMYMAMCFYEEGFIHLPENMSILQSYLDTIVKVSPIQDETNQKIERVNDYLEAKRKAF